MRTIAFATTFVVLFGLSYGFLAAVDALPNPPTTAQTDLADSDAANTGTPTQVLAGTQEAPVRVVAKDVGLNSKVVNPTATDLDTLNAAVDEAAMRWPTSAKLG